MAATRVLMLQLDPADAPGRLGEWLRDAGAEVTVCDLAASAAGAALPDSLDDIDGVVVLGGGMGAADDDRHPFLRDVRALLREVVRQEVPTLGVCLGAQLLALAHGGRVEPIADGPELGAQLVAKRAAAATDPLFGPMPITPDVIQWHYDAVTTLPAGAVHLASSPAVDHQAFRVGRLAWGIQFHIETTPEVVADWARADAPLLPDHDLDGIVQRAERVHDDLAEAWAPFAAAFVEVAGNPAAVRPASGPASSTAGPVSDPGAIRAALAGEAEAARGAPGGAPLPMPERRPAGD